MPSVDRLTRTNVTITEALCDPNASASASTVDSVHRMGSGSSASQ